MGNNSARQKHHIRYISNDYPTSELSFLEVQKASLKPPWAGPCSPYLQVPPLELSEVDTVGVRHGRSKIIAANGLAVVPLKVQIHAFTEPVLADQGAVHANNLEYQDTRANSNISDMNGNEAGMNGNKEDINGNTTAVKGSMTAITGSIAVITGNITVIIGSITGMNGNISSIDGNKVGSNGNKTDWMAT